MVLNSTLRLRRSTLIGWIFLPLLLLCCVAYYFAFAANMDAYDGDAGLFQLALNSNDHYVYLLNMDLLRRGDGFFELANDKGIALIYTFLLTLFPFFVNADLTLISLIFNCSIICCCYWIYASICDQLNLNSLGKLSFFANLSFIYFAQLINKDALTILVFLLTVQCGIRGRLFPLLMLLPVFLLVHITHTIYPTACLLGISV
jgi:hypothetical protein